MRRWIVAIGAMSILLVVAALIVVAPAEARHGGQGAGKTVVPNDLTTDQVHTAVEAWLDGVGLGDLNVGTSIAFTNHTWVAVVDPATGNNALELVVDRDGVVHPQQTLIWNTAYHTMLAGHEPMSPNAIPGTMSAASHHQAHGTMPHGTDGMMNGDQTRDQMRVMDPEYCDPQAGQTPATTLAEPLTADAARTTAQQWLDTNRPGAVVGTVYGFPGYFTFEVTIDGKLDGLLSVQASTGTVLPQAWHHAVRAAS